MSGITKTFAGSGKSRPQIEASVEKLHLDADNPRLPEEYQGKRENDILLCLKRNFDLEELAYSMAENGYFDEEPLVAFPEKLPKEFEGKTDGVLKADPEYKKFIDSEETEFVVVEGNRRLATIKILLDSELRTKLKATSWPALKKDIEEDLRSVPVIIYSERNKVLPYLGVRHITGVKKWEAYAKARYVASMVKVGVSIDDVQRQVGDRANSVRKIYLAYRLIEEVENEFEFDTSGAKKTFSYLILALGQGAVKSFIGVSPQLNKIDLDNPVPDDKKENLKLLFSWLFGEEGKPTVLKESRDITNKLTPILRNELSTKHLIAYRDLNDAYDRSDGEKELLMKYLRNTTKNLSKAFEFMSIHKDEQAVKEEFERLKRSFEQLSKFFEV